LKTTVVEIGVVETGVTGTDAAVEEGVETEGAAVTVLVAVAAEAQVVVLSDVTSAVMIFAVLDASVLTVMADFVVLIVLLA
jgi:hypothetical protein